MSKPVEQRTHAKSINRGGQKRTRSTQGRTENSKIGNAKIGHRCHALVEQGNGYVLRRVDRTEIDGTKVVAIRRGLARKISDWKKVEKSAVKLNDRGTVESIVGAN